MTWLEWLLAGYCTGCTIAGGWAYARAWRLLREAERVMAGHADNHR